MLSDQATRESQAAEEEANEYLMKSVILLRRNSTRPEAQAEEHEAKRITEKLEELNSAS